MGKNQVWKWIAVLAVLQLAACASSPDSDEYQSYDDYDQSTESANRIQHRIGNQAAVNLYNEAKMAASGQDYDTAAMLLERALRLEPEDAVMWSKLAEVHLLQGNANQAENIAAKSNTLSINNSLLNYRNWKIIGQARALKGDEIGAQEAEYTAESFRN